MASDKIAFAAALLLASVSTTQAQSVEDGPDAAIGRENARMVLDLVEQRFKDSDPKVTSLRKAEGSWICGSVDVKNHDGRYTGERGFVVDLSNAFFGRVPDGPELLSSRTDDFEEKERIRLLYFKMCLD